MGPITRICSAPARPASRQRGSTTRLRRGALAGVAAALLLPTPALANTDGLAAYLRARLAASRGQPGAAADYARALDRSPDVSVAARAFREALAAGDFALARRAEAVLARAGVAPEDARLLPLAEAARAGDERRVEQVLASLASSRLSLISPAVRAWMGRDAGTEPTDPVARRLLAEARALVLVGRGDARDGVGRLRTLSGVNGGPDTRLAAAELLARRGEPALARALFPAEDLVVGPLVAAGGAKPSLGFGVSRLLSRLAADLISGEPTPLGVSLTRAALVADPRNDRARLLLAAALKAEGAVDRALAVLAEVPAESPFAATAAAARIQLLSQSDRRPEALAQAGHAAQRERAGRNDWQVYADLLSDAGRHSEAVAWYRRIAEGEGAREWDVWLQFGGALELAGDWTGARGALERAVALGPDEPLALNYLGYARLTRGEARRESTALLERARKLAPDDPAIADSLGWAYHLAGDTRRALPLLETAAQAEAGNAEIAEHLGDAYWTLGRRFEARYAWAAAAVVADAKDKPRLQAKVARGL